jgi:hypothetical protein
MIEQTRWIERRFNFDFPVGLWPNIMERLRGTALRINAIVKDLPTEATNSRIDDAWSINEEVGHLRQVDNLFEHRLDQYLQRATELVAADMKNRSTESAD